MSKPVILAISSEFLARDGLSETIQPWEDGQRVPTDRGAFEWWYFDAQFQDGTTAVIVFATKPIINPAAPLTPNLSLTITRADGHKTIEFDLPPPNQFSASTESCNVCIGSSWARWSEASGHWIYHLHAETHTMAADLTFRGLVPPWRPGAGKAYFGSLDRYFAWLSAIPYGSVEGMLRYDGQTHVVQGMGYHDHNWGNVALPAVLDHWTWGRAHISEYSLIFVEQIAHRRYGSARIPAFLFAKGTQVLADDAHFLTTEARRFVRHPGGRVYPQEIDFTWARDREQIRLTLREPVLIEAASLLFTLSPWLRPLARLLANPYYFRFSATLHLDIELDGLHDSVRGPALYEIMLLR